MENITSEFQEDPDFAELLQAFVESLAESVAQILSGVEGGRHDAVTRTVHQLRGAGGGFGFPGLSARAALLESFLRAGGPLDGPLVADFVDYCRRVDGYRTEREASAPVLAPLRRSA